MIIPRLVGLFDSGNVIPQNYRRNFFHFYMDIAWWGVLTGSTIGFLSIYATRLGATGAQIGLINAAPAIVTLIFALPAGSWLARRPIQKSIFKTSVLTRIFYLLLVPLPWLFNDPQEVWAIIAITFLMNVPGAVFAVGFTAFYAEGVSPEFRAHVSGIRNAMVSLMSMLTSLVCGLILTYVDFPTGYQIVFGIGFLGAAMSSLHLFLINPANFPPAAPVRNDGEGRSGRRESRLRLDVVQNGDYRRVVLLLAFFHLGQYLAIPVFPLYAVNTLHLSDQVLSLGSAVFYVTVLFGALQLERLSHRLGNRRVTAWGVVLMGAYPVLLIVCRTPILYISLSIVSGVAWSMAGGALFNYLLERVPADDRPAHLAWYNVGLNASILVGSLLGPLLAEQFGFGPALVLFASLRMLAGLSILRWG